MNTVIKQLSYYIYAGKRRREEREGIARKKNEHHQFIALVFKIKSEEIYNTTLNV